MGACCQQVATEKAKIQYIKYQDLENYVEVLQILQFQKSIQKYIISDKQDKKEKIMIVIQKQQEQYLNLILSLKTRNLQTIEFIFQTDLNSILIQKKLDCEPIFHYCESKSSILDEALVKQLFQQLLQVIKLVLNMKLTLNFHSPSQILVTEQNQVILEGILVMEQTKNMIGSILKPPEGDESNQEKQIVWKCGILLLILLTGALPNKFCYLYPYSVKGLAKDLIFDPEDPNLSFLSRKLISEMLKENPEQRISLAKALNHQWFKVNSNNVTPRQVLSSDLIQFDKDLVQSLDIEFQLRQFIATQSFLLQNFERFDQHISNIAQQSFYQQKQINQNQQIQNYLKNQIKNEAMVLSIFQNKKINDKEVLLGNKILNIDNLKEWKENINNFVTQKLRECFTNGKVKSAQVKGYLEIRMQSEVNSIILRVKNKNSFELSKIDYSFDEFVAFLKQEVKNKIKDQLNNQNLTFMEQEQIIQDFSELQSILQSDQNYKSNPILIRIISDINDIVNNNSLQEIENQRQVQKLLIDFQKQYQSQRSKMLIKQLINKLQL